MEEKWTWWKHGVIYQIYPRSFYDSNGDGVGDIPGIIEKLDYLEELGIDGIWISPVNISPMYDFGYDISDYYNIDPVFGTLDDFKKLVRESHKRGIRIIMDLVLNHTSHLHPWFMESRSSVDNPKRDWYIWRPGNEKKPPNNWESAFSGTAWKFDGITGEYYLHSFLEEQPDLNWENRDMKKEMFRMVRYWLDLGVDGFRLDVVNFLIKDKYFRNNPRRIISGIFRNHKYGRNRPGVHELMREFREILDSYDEKMAVGEVFNLPPSPGMSADFLGNGTDELHLAFDFSLMYRMWNARSFYKTIRRWMKTIPGWLGLPCPLQP